MNQQAFEAGKTAYRQGKMEEAIDLLREAKQPGEVSGSIDHMIGNCLMRQGRYAEAANSYADAMQDSSYGNSGALACNRGRALLAAGRPQEAIASLTMATKDASYATPYKAYTAIGNAYLKLGNPRDAGVAFRSAAIDENNPEPSSALRSLGGCFMQLGRAVDAVEAYRTALDFSSPNEDQNIIYADLGMAYVAANRMSEAVDAFAHATADGNFVLGPEFQAAYDAAKRAVTASKSPSETDQLLAAAGYGSGAKGSFDPLDPLGETGEFMPSPEDTGFFSITEEEMRDMDRRERKQRRKRKHSGFKGCFITLLLVALIGGGGFAIFKGFGWPTQDAVATDLFTKDDISGVLAKTVTDDGKARIEALVPSGGTSVKVTGRNSSMFESKVFATVTLSAGGTQDYEIDMVRDGIGWKVDDLSVVYVSQDVDGATIDDGSAEATSEETTPETTAESTEAAQAEGENAEAAAEEGESANN